MRSLIIIGAGFALWLLLLGISKWQQLPFRQMTVMFCGIWFAVALFNMWLGVSIAGYAVREEFPIFLLIFLPPSIFAGAVYWQFGRRNGQ